MLLGAISPGIGAQDYRWDRVEELGVKFLVRSELERVPLKLDNVQPNLRARYKPVREGDYIWGSKGKYVWYLWVYEFVPRRPLTAQLPPPSGKSTTGGPARRDAAASYGEFVTASAGKQDFRRFLVEGEPRKANQASGKKLPFTWWEYTDTQAGQLGAAPQTWHVCAASYELTDREIALVASIPITKGTRLESKYRAWATKMLLSLSTLDSNELAAPERGRQQELFVHADSPARRQAVHDAIANIRELENWDIFTTQNYIVVFSWPAGRADKKEKREIEARDIAEHMDRMRELYARHYPPLDQTALPYSVLRICSTADEFQRYSNTGERELSGWFSPVSKELVLFADTDRERTKTVAYHEGWHQYSDWYFDLPSGVELPRWFDEGTGDFFGSFEWSGSKWRYDISRMRKLDVKTIVNTDAFVPLEEIVTWSRSRFYGPDAAAYYAQGYAMVDFLARGPLQRQNGWDDSWNDILETFCATMLAERDPDVAIDTAFKNVDWERLTRAWIRWVKDY